MMDLMRKLNLLDSMIIVAATAAGLALFRMFLAKGWFFQGDFFGGSFASYVLSGIEAIFPFLAVWTFALVILGLRQPRPRIRRLVRQPGMAACFAASLMLVVQLLGIVPFEVVRSVRNIVAEASMPRATLPELATPVGFSSPPAKNTAAYGMPTPANSPARASSLSSSLPPQGEPHAIFSSMPGANMGPTDNWPTWFILRAIHVHMIQRGYVAAAVAGAWFVLAVAGWWRPQPTWIDRLGRAAGFLWTVPYLVYHANLGRLF
jgi:hypothetical protein